MDKIMERIASLMEAKKINGSKLQIACNLNNSAIYKWKKGEQRPSAEAIVKIADYFNVSTDYLLGRIDNPHPNNYIPKNNIPYDVLKNWELLSQHEIDMVSTLIKNLVNGHK